MTVLNFPSFPPNSVTVPYLMIFLQIQLEKNKVLIRQFFQTTTSVVIHPAFQLVEMEAVLLLLLRFISPVHLSFVLIPYYLLKNFERKKNRE